ncbi:MAG: peptidoglycan DD-metalloendopeptidase family protein, partial [Candidatus Anstonellales archaeon]
IPEYSLDQGICSIKTSNVTDVSKLYFKFLNDSYIIAKHVNDPSNGLLPSNYQYPEYGFRYFAIGGGRYGFEFEQANRVCGNGFQIVSYWITGLPYSKPVRAPMKCYLEKNVFPLYILYSGKDHDSMTVNEWNQLVASSELVAKNLSKLNSPVVVTTEINFDFSNDPNNKFKHVPYIVDQTIKLLDNCPKCFVAITPKYNNYVIMISNDTNKKGVLTLLREKVGEDKYKEYKKRLLVGIGLMLNDLPDFTPNGVIANLTYPNSMPRVMQFTEDLPTIIIYLMAKKELRKIETEYATPFSKEDEEELKNMPKIATYKLMNEKMFADVISVMYYSSPLLVSRGIIGFVVPKYYNDTKDYICGGKCLSLLDNNNGFINNLSYAFFKGCYDYTRRMPQPLVFATYGGNSFCSFQANYISEKRLYESEIEYPDYNNISMELGLISSRAPYLGCDNCYGFAPEPFYNVTEYQKRLISWPSSGNCPIPSKYKEYILKYASIFPTGNVRSEDLLDKMDPLLIAAVIYRESSFNEKAVSSANALGLMQILPSNVVSTDPNDLIDDACKETNAFRNYVQEYKNSQTLEEREEAKKKLLFDPEFNICYGTQLLSDRIYLANYKINNRSDKWFKVIEGNENNPQYVLWMSIYLGLLMYNSYLDKIDAAIKNWLNSNKQCNGIFMPFEVYVYNCSTNGLPSETRKYAYNILAIYNALAENDDCLDNYCGEEYADNIQNTASDQFLPISMVDARGVVNLPVGNITNVVTSCFGMRMHPVLNVYRMHTGIDIAGSERDILAVAKAKVIKVRTDNPSSGYGHYVVLQDLNYPQYTYLYAHLSSVSVSVGQIVNPGQKIGVMGSTGISTGVHLHFEIRKNNAPQSSVNQLSKYYGGVNCK